MNFAIKASKIMAALAMIPALLCGGPATAQRIGDTVSLERPQIKALSAPHFVETGNSFKVEVSADYLYGISAIEIGFNGQVQRIPARSDRNASVVAEFRASEVRDNRLTAVAISADGKTRSTASMQPVFVGVEQARRAPQSQEEYFKRVSDRTYLDRVGTMQYQDWPVFSETRPWWNVWFESGGPKPFDWKNKCPGPIGGIGGGINAEGDVLECWLKLNPNVANSIVWQELDPNAGPLDQFGVHTGVVTNMPYSQWTPVMKIQLNVAVFYAWEWLHGELDWFNGPYLPPAPPNQLQLKDEQGTYTILSRDDAWNLYLGTIAHSLALELGGFVPWSIANYSTYDLSFLFNSNQMFAAKNWTLWLDANTLTSATGYWVFDMIPAPPTLNFETMVKEDMIRPTQYRTVGRYLKWGRDFQHTGQWLKDGQVILGDGIDAKSAQAYWGYRGVAVAASIISGTTMPNPWNPSSTWPLTHWVLGCPSMSHFTQQLMRAVNIPVAIGNVGQTGHTTPFFWTINYTMSHGDDMYTSHNRATPAFPGEWLLLPIATYDDWFYGAGMLGDNGYANVGRQAAIEVPLKSLPDNLLQSYCADKLANATHVNGKVAAYFRDDDENVTFYTVPQLEAKNLWTKLGNKAASLGLCGP